MPIKQLHWIFTHFVNPSNHATCIYVYSLEWFLHCYENEALFLYKLNIYIYAIVKITIKYSIHHNNIEISTVSIRRVNLIEVRSWLVAIAITSVSS